MWTLLAQNEKVLWKGLIAVTKHFQSLNMAVFKVTFTKSFRFLLIIPLITYFFILDSSDGSLDFAVQMQPDYHQETILYFRINFISGIKMSDILFSMMSAILFILKSVVLFFKIRAILFYHMMSAIFLYQDESHFASGWASILNHDIRQLHNFSRNENKFSVSILIELNYKLDYDSDIFPFATMRPI